MNESWVLPAISQLNGRPEVAKNGQIAQALTRSVSSQSQLHCLGASHAQVYVFDDLQTTAGKSFNQFQLLYFELQLGRKLSSR